MPSTDLLPAALLNLVITPLSISKSTTLLSANLALFILIICSLQFGLRQVIHKAQPFAPPRHF